MGDQRGLATRYDRRPDNFLAALKLARDPDLDQCIMSPLASHPLARQMVILRKARSGRDLMNPLRGG